MNEDRDHIDEDAPDDDRDATLQELFAKSPLVQQIIERCEGEDRDRALQMVDGVARYYDEMIRMVRENVKTEEDLVALLQAIKFNP